jgi:hypothetical protein
MSSQDSAAGNRGSDRRVRPDEDPARLRNAILRDLRKGPGYFLARSFGTLRRIYQLRRYRYNLRRLYVPLDSVPIDRPIFILGTQGGGGTVLARCLHRHPSCVYTMGNSSYWTGSDEIHHSPHIPDVPEPLVHRSFHLGTVTPEMEDHPRYGYQRAWLYAIDEFLPRYRKTADDVDPQTTSGFRDLLRNIMRAYAHDPRSCRLVDKSQLFTIQVPYIAKMLEGCNPHFVVLVRNPYAACARACAKEYNANWGGYIEDDWPERIRCTVQHWTNSYRIALESESDVPMLRVRYEDFLEDPETVVRRICDFAGLDFRISQIPASGQKLPAASLDEKKWYPLRAAENDKYLRDIDPDLVRALNERAGDLIEDLGYERIVR